MCILVVLKRRVEGWPLLVGANRDEARDRPWDPPRREGEVVAPRDRAAGGSWFAVHDRGLVVAITNRPDAAPDPARPSRGLLVLGAARAGSVAAARRTVHAALSAGPRSPFQLLLADAREAVVLVNAAPGGPLAEIGIGDGLHTLTNLRGVDELDHRGALSPLDLPAGTPLPAAISAMEAALAVHAGEGPGGADEICKHGGRRGTLSSSIAAIPAGGGRPRFRFAAGRPCETTWADTA